MAKFDQWSETVAVIIDVQAEGANVALQIIVHNAPKPGFQASARTLYYFFFR